jgi:hypothetical protein
VHPILADPLRLRLYLLAWGLVGAMLALLVRHLIGVDWLRSVAFAAPMAVVAAPVSLSAWYLCRALPLSRTAPVRIAATALATAIVTSGLWAGLGRLWWDGLERFIMPMGVSRPTCMRYR